MVSEKNFSMLFLLLVYGVDDPLGVANSYSNGMTGRIYLGCQLTFGRTKYTSFRLCGFTEED